MSSHLKDLFILVIALTILNSAQSQLGPATNKASLALSPERMLAEDDQLINDLDKVEFDKLLVTNGLRDHLSTMDYYQPSCQLMQIVHLLKHPGCQSKAIASFACFGSCPSYVKTSNSKLWEHERSCMCCQQTGSQEATFTLDCPSLDPPFRKVKTHAPLDCLCRSCTDLRRENIRPQELLDALATEMSSTKTGTN